MDYGGGRKRKYAGSDAIVITPEASSAGGIFNSQSEWATVNDEASRPSEAHQIPSSTSSTSSTLVGEDSGGKYCKKFRTAEGCPRGGSCKFLHDDQSRSRENLAVSILPAVGGGLYGSRTSEQNPRPLNWKTRLCIYWERGYCNRGSSCNYAHGAAELQGHGRTHEQMDNRGSTQAGASSRARTDPIVSSTTSVAHGTGVPTMGTDVANQRPGCWFHHPRMNDMGYMSRIYGDWLYEIPPRANPDPNPNK